MLAKNYQHRQFGNVWTTSLPRKSAEVHRAIIKQHLFSAYIA